MTSKSMRSFAGGLLVASGICGAVYYSDSDEKATTQTTKELTTNEMKSLLSSEGYVIHTEEEWETQLADVTSKKDETDAGETEKIIYRSVIKVSKGMTSIDVGKLLKRSKIIPNAQDFYNEVEKKGMANHLRPGSYVIDSEMTSDEIISTIFK